jgi:hypothetical protein
MTYQLVTHHGSQGIQCLLCGLTSWHPMDVQERYCGRCHIFHEDVTLAGAADIWLMHHIDPSSKEPQP